MTMRPRLPREPDTWVSATCDNLQELARAYAPTLDFNKEENFFPVLAEAYLAHVGYGPWPDDSDPHAATGLGHLLPTDEAHRGTALVTVIRDDGHVEVRRQGGAPNAAGRPLQFTTDPGDQDAIGRSDRQGAAGAPLHLVFGGWSNPDERSAGDEAYLAAAFSEFADAMSPQASWDAKPRPHLPTFWVRQPPTPTVYAEVAWTGTFPDRDEAAGLGDFAPGPDDHDNDRLDGYLQITYHYLFPVRRPSDPDAPAGEQTSRFEGQWQAATLFFEVLAAGTHEDAPTPENLADLAFHEPPVAVVLSRHLDATPRAQTVAWDDLDKFQLTRADELPPLVSSSDWQRHVDSTSAVIYVGGGTHTFLPAPVSGREPFPAATGGPDSATDAEDLGTDDDFTTETVGTFFLALLLLLAALLVLAALLWALWTLAQMVSLLAAAALTALVIVALLALVVLIAAIAWLENWLDRDGDEPHRREGNEEATGDGAAGSPPPTETDGTPGPPSDASGGTSSTGGVDDPNREGSDVDAGAYQSGVGAPRGHNHAVFDVRVIDMVNDHPVSPFPPEPGSCEYPAWWRFSGHWGVPVHVREAAGWRNGQPRIDEHGRSWAYWHAVTLDEHLSL